MKPELPGAVPEIPVSHIGRATEYYCRCLGFHLDFGDEAGGIAGLSQGQCRLFLTHADFRDAQRNAAPVVVWINLEGRAAVDALHRAWIDSGAKVLAPPASKPWKLYEFTALDLDGNRFRVFYDFAWEST